MEEQVSPQARALLLMRPEWVCRDEAIKRLKLPVPSVCMSWRVGRPREKSLHALGQVSHAVNGADTAKFISG